MVLHRIPIETQFNELADKIKNAPTADKMKAVWQFTKTYPHIAGTRAYSDWLRANAKELASYSPPQLLGM